MPAWLVSSHTRVAFISVWSQSCLSVKHVNLAAVGDHQGKDTLTTCDILGRVARGWPLDGKQRSSNTTRADHLYGWSHQCAAHQQGQIRKDNFSSPGGIL